MAGNNLETVDRIDVLEGKYTILLGDEGKFSVLRYGEPWIESAHGIPGSRCWYALACELLDLRVLDKHEGKQETAGTK